MISISPFGESGVRVSVDPSLVAGKRSGVHPYVTLHIGEDGSVVGLEIVAARKVAPEWNEHPDRAALPKEVRAKVDEALASMKSAA